MTDPRPDAPSTDPAEEPSAEAPGSEAGPNATAPEKSEEPGTDAPAKTAADDTPRLVALLRRRRPWVLAAAAGVVVAVVATLVVTLSGDDERAVPPGAMPTLGNQFASTPPSTAPSTPAKRETLPAFTGNPLWTVPLPAGVGEYSPPAFAVSAHGYVVEHDDAVIGLGRDGKETWRFTPPAVDYFTVRVTGPQVFVGYENPDDDRWPQPQVIVALDAASGTELWRDGEPSLWAVTTDTIYMSVCYGGQNTRVGDCTLSARDPATNTTRWRIPTYASSRLVNDSDDMQAEPTPPYLLIGAYPTGANTWVVSSHDPATGATIGDGFAGPDDDIGSMITASPRTVVTNDDFDDNPADGCSALLIGFTSGATEKWRYTARTAKYDDGKRCSGQPDSVNDGRMGVTTKDGAPSVLNVETGAIEWSAPPKGEALAASDDTLLVVESTEEEAAELVAYQVGGKERWRAPFFGEPDTSTVAITGTTVMVAGVGYDLATGKAWSYGENVAQETRTWFAACDKTSCRGYPIG